MSKARQKGTAWESAIVRYLQEHGHPFAERRAMAGALDKGDILLPGCMIEAKAERQFSLATYLKEVRAQTANCPPGTVGVAWVKAPGKSVDDSYVVMDPATFLRLLGE